MLIFNDSTSPEEPRGHLPCQGWVWGALFVLASTDGWRVFLKVCTSSPANYFVSLSWLAAPRFLCPGNISSPLYQRPSTPTNYLVNFKYGSLMTCLTGWPSLPTQERLQDNAPFPNMRPMQNKDANTIDVSGGKDSFMFTISWDQGCDSGEELFQAPGTWSKFPRIDCSLRETIEGKLQPAGVLVSIWRGESKGD